MQYLQLLFEMEGLQILCTYNYKVTIQNQLALPRSQKKKRKKKHFLCCVAVAYKNQSFLIEYQLSVLCKSLINGSLTTTELRGVYSLGSPVLSP